MSTETIKPRIRAIPRPKSRILLVAAIFILVAAIVGLIPTTTIFRVLNTAGGFVSGRLASISRIKPSIPTVIVLVLTGLALLFSGKHKALPPISAILLIVSLQLYYGSYMSGIVMLLMQLSALCLLLSVIGWRWNIVPRFLKKAPIPLLTLLSALLALFAIPQGARWLETFITSMQLPPIVSYLYMAIWLLPLVSLLLVSLASETQYIDAPIKKETRRAIPQGGVAYHIAMWMLLVSGAAGLISTVLTSYDTSGLLTALPLLAAGILLIIGKGGEKHFIAAVVCLTLSVATRIFNLEYYGVTGLWTFVLPTLLMLISAIGVLRNISIPALSKIIRAPILNIIAAVLLIIGVIGGIASTLEHNAVVRETRATSLANAAGDAGEVVAYAEYERQQVEDALSEFDEAKTAADTALNNVEELVKEERMAQIRRDIEMSVLNVDVSRISAGPAPLLEIAIQKFTAALGEASEDALAVYEELVAAGHAVSGDSSLPVELPTEAPADEDAPAAEDQDLIEIAEEAISTLYNAESRVTYAARWAEDATAEAIDGVTRAAEDVETAVQNAKDSSTAWHVFAVGVLTYVGLILLNLSLGSRAIEQRGIFAAFLHACRRVFSWFYRDVGGKLQMLAKVQAVICMVIACAATITAAVGLCGFLVSFFFDGTGLNNLIILAAGIGGIISSFLLALPTWFLYAFGQITADVHEVKENGGIAAPEYFEENPDDLPEL